MSFNKVKGTYDVLPNESKNWVKLENYVRNLYNLFNYQEIRTPIIEYSNVFHRASEGSDMVIKETYNFKDRSNRDLTLRPEGTAGSIRSYVENKLYVNNGLTKLFYIGPNFRYERPQKGRFRQFMQFGVEALGSNDPRLDSEVIELAYQTINQLGLKQVSVKINSLGDEESKLNFRKNLVDYLMPFESKLSKDSKERLVNNPLRILDSKDEGDIEITKNAPLPLDYLSESSKKHFEQLINHLDNLNIPYEVDKKLVRGLDYYSETVFEIHATTDGFGAQNALGGGGRYQNLVKEFGGPETPGIGFAFGMERLLSALEIEGVYNKVENCLDAYIITFNEDAKNLALKIQSNLRLNGFTVDINYTNKSFKAQLKEALNYGAKNLLILGEDEIKNNTIEVKDTLTEKQVTVSMINLINHLKEHKSNE